MLRLCCSSPLLLLSSLKRECDCQAWSLAHPALNTSMWEARGGSACGPPLRTASVFRLKDILMCNQWHLNRCVIRGSLSWVQIALFLLGEYEPLSTWIEYFCSYCDTYITNKDYAFIRKRLHGFFLYGTELSAYIFFYFCGKLQVYFCFLMPFDK